MNYLETLKNIAKDKNKRVENLIFLLILLVILLISTKYIFSSNSTSSVNNKIDNKEEQELVNTSSTNETAEDLESKLENILTKISGISEVSVVLTYSKDTTATPIYNISEEEKEGSKTTEKSVAYNEESGKKTAIIESIEMPQVEGAIVVAKGASNTEMKSRIATAVSTVTNVPAYKVQVFESK